MADAAPSFTFSDEPPKRGPGRPKGSTNKTAPSQAEINSDVKKALATLESAYNLTATGLVMFGLNKSAEMWIETAEDLKKTNEDALKASPKLAKAIAQTGTVGGGATFLLTHGMAVFGLFNAVRSELADRRADAYLAEHPTPDDATGI